ncbi:MAG: phosphoribosylanthranilate isomerase [Nitrospirae bacterium]|nr:phosphoribosylanthranilate isomerase [Nitrospirota bacterium]
MVKVKICGITNIEDALAAVKFGADALGFVFYKGSPRVITPDRAKDIISKLPPLVSTVGVFVNEDLREIKRIIQHAGLDTVQLHGDEPPEMCAISRRIIKAIRVKDLTDLEPLSRYKVSAFLLDTYTPETLGGTGQIFNWDIAVEAKRFGRIILAGGLTPQNVAEAIQWVRPYGIDVATGVEGAKKEKKDHAKMKLFIHRAKSVPEES